MNAGIPQVSPHTREQHLKFLPRPAEAVLLRRPRENRETGGGNTVKGILVGPDAELLVFLVFGPAVEGPLLTYNMNVDETCIGKLLLVIERRAYGTLDERRG